MSLYIINYRRISLSVVKIIKCCQVSAYIISFCHYYSSNIIKYSKYYQMSTDIITHRQLLLNFLKSSHLSNIVKYHEVFSWAWTVGQIVLMLNSDSYCTNFAALFSVTCIVERVAFTVTVMRIKLTVRLTHLAEIFDILCIT